MIDFSMMVEGFFAILLIAVLVYAVRLNRHIASLQKNRTELEALIKSFMSSTERAESAIARMKQASHDNQTVLDAQIKEAARLKDELEDVIALASGLQESARAGRNETTVSPRRTSRQMHTTERETSSVSAQEVGVPKDKLRAELDALRAKQEEKQKGADMSLPRPSSFNEDDIRHALMREVRDEARSIAGTGSPSDLPPQEGASPQPDEQGGSALRNKSKADLLKALQGIR